MVKLALKQSTFGGPKAAKTAYMLFADEVRSQAQEEVVAKHGKVVLAEVGKVVAEKWKNVSAEKKSELDAKSKEDKARYEQEYKAWEGTDEYKKMVKARAEYEMKEANKKAKDAAKESGMPSKPLSAYFAFGNQVREEERAKGNSLAAPDIAKVLKERWANIAPEAKAALEEKAKAEKEQYDKDLAAWLETDAGKAYKATENSNKKKFNDTMVRDANKLAKNSGMPAKPKNAQALFAVDFKAEKGEEITDVKELNAQAKSAWEALDAASKKVYEDKAKAAEKEYNVQMKEFKKTDAWKELNKAQAAKKRTNAAAAGGSPKAKRAKVEESADVENDASNSAAASSSTTVGEEAEESTEA